MVIHIEGANNPQPTMTAIAAMGNNPNPFKYMKTAQPTLLYTKEVKCPNEIIRNNNKSQSTTSHTYHHIQKT